jgi:hypothetical protein
MQYFFAHGDGTCGGCWCCNRAVFPPTTVPPTTTTTVPPTTTAAGCVWQNYLLPGSFSPEVGVPTGELAFATLAEAEASCQSIPACVGVVDQSFYSPCAAGRCFTPRFGTPQFVDHFVLYFKTCPGPARRLLEFAEKPLEGFNVEKANVNKLQKLKIYKN